jgi:hypothetical protein
MKIPFVGPSYQARSTNAATERSVNVYLEKNPSPGREWALYGMPGLTLRVTTPVAVHRGAIRMGALTFCVAGNTVYKIDTAYTATALGTIGTATGRVGMATDGDEVLIVDGVSGWIASAGALTEIADVDFPDGVTQCGCLDSYFLVIGDDQKVYWNETPGTGTAWNGLDFASAEGAPDNIIAMVIDHRELWLFGTETTEIWVNTGDVDAPFQRSGNAFIERGTAAAFSPSKADNSVMWLGRGEQGEGMVFRAEGYSPVKISSDAMDTAIRGYSTIDDAYSYTFELDGHTFYVLSFPTADATWVYDAATSAKSGQPAWLEWLWRDPATNEFHRHRSAWHVFNGRKHLVGDWETGKVYTLEPEVYTDNGDAIKRLRMTQTISNGGKRLFFGELFLDMETGVANAAEASPEIMLRYSNDSGHSWSNEKIKSLGATGEYSKRVKFGPTGSGRNRVWELSMTDPVEFALFGAEVTVESE